jgi:hypothetical protein
MAVRVDVGASSYWSEIGTLQTLDALLDKKVISPEIYIEMIPDTVLNGKAKILESLKSMNKTQTVVNLALMDFVKSLPPENQQSIRNLPEEQMQNAAMEMYVQQMSQKQQEQTMMPAPMGGAAEAATRPM